MRQVEKTVFISYRRTNVPWALSIFQNLTHNGYDVFFDFQGIASGDFEGVILENIKARAHFIVILTPSALKRCDDSNDWLRREIETAMDTQRNIVPLMFEGFDFTAPAIANHLTGKLAALKRYNALSVPAEYFDEAMRRLQQKYLDVPLDAVLHPTSVTARQTAVAEQAAASAAPGVRLKELSAQEWFEKAWEYSDYEQVIHCYSEAIRLKPDYAEAYKQRADKRYFEKDDFDGALLDYGEAIRLKPGYVEAYLGRGRMRLYNGDSQGALRDIEEAICLKPGYAPAYSARAAVHEHNSDLDSALRDYDEAIRLEPDDPWNYYEDRALRRRLIGDLEGALRDYNELIAHEPSAYYYKARGDARRLKGTPLRALRDIEEAIRLKPDYAGAYSSRARLRQDIHDLDGALRDYDEAIRLDPDSSDAYYYRANARTSKGDLDGAIADLKTYLDLVGNSLDDVRAEVEERIRSLEKARYNR